MGGRSYGAQIQSGTSRIEAYPVANVPHRGGSLTSAIKCTLAEFVETFEIKDTFSFEVHPFGKRRTLKKGVATPTRGDGWLALYSKDIIFT